MLRQTSVNLFPLILSQEELIGFGSRLRKEIAVQLDRPAKDFLCHSSLIRLWKSFKLREDSLGCL